jgi:hypothetical protein
VSAAELAAISGILLAVAVVLGVVMGRTVKAEVGTVKAEFRNNGGSTLRDAVDAIRQEQKNIRGVADRIETNQGDVLGRLEAHGEELTRLSERVAALESPPPTLKAARSTTPRKRAAS